MSNMLHSFGVNAQNKLKRSKWRFPISNKTSFRQGALVPLGWTMVIPSSTISLDFASLVRCALTFAKPVMGDMYFTYGAYFVPERILYKNYEEMFGNGKPSEWSSPTEYVIPAIDYVAEGSVSPSSSLTGYDAIVPGSVSVNSNGQLFSKPGNLAGYLGLPSTVSGSTGTDDKYSLNMHALLSYERIWSDFYRDENYQNEDPDLEKAKAFSSGSTGSRSTLRFGLHYANRFHDYFTSLLPAPQKGTPVSAFSSLVAMNSLYKVGGSGAIQLGNNGTALSNTDLKTSSYGIMVGDPLGGSVGGTSINSTNLGVDISVNDLRMAFALQRAKERNGRTGSRYVEALLGTFEARLPNSVAQKAEFLGGNTIPLNQTSVPSTDSTPGKLGAFSATGSRQSVFVKTFNEPGIIMIVGCVRVKHSYQQGIHKFWRKLRRYDEYDPAFAHISEQPVLKSELFAQGNSTDAQGEEPVLGFNEAWVEYKRPIDLITGNLKYTSGQDDINSWTFQTNLSSAEITPSSYYPEKHNEVANCCIDYNSNLPDFVFIGDFKGEFTVTAPCPVYNDPGLIDHLVA